MRRWSACLVVFSLAFTDVGAAEPPYKRLLQGEEARKVTELEARRLALEKAGKYAEALAAAQEVLRQRLCWQGPSHWQIDDARLVVATLEKLLTLDSEQQQRWVDFHRLEDEGRTRADEGKYAAAEELSRKALALCEKVLGPEHPFTGRSYSNLAVTLLHEGKHSEAISLFRKTAQIWEQSFGLHHPDTALVYNNLGNALEEQGKPGEAERLLRKALDIWTETYGPRHPQTAHVCNSLGLFLDGQGKPAEAEPYLRRALTVREEAFGPSHRITARGYGSLGSNLVSQGRVAEAEPLLRKALHIREETLGLRHPDTAASYNGLAVCLQKEGKYAEAEPLYRKALAISSAVFVLPHPTTACYCNNLGQNLDAQGKLEEAELLLRKAITLWEQASPSHPDTTTARKNLAACLNHQGKDAEAEKLLRRTLDFCLRTCGPDHPETAHTYNSLAVSLDAEEKHQEAERLYRKALAIRERVFPAGHPAIANSYHNLAVNLELQGKHSEAEPLHRKALANLERSLSPHHADRAQACTSLGHNLAAQNKLSEAERYLRQAVEAAEAARLQLASTGFDRAMSGRTLPHLQLAVCLARQNKAQEAWEAAEAGMGRALLDNLAGIEAGMAPKARQQHERAAHLQNVERQLIPLLSAEKLSPDQQKARDRLSQERDALLSEIDREAVEEARQRILPLPRIQKYLAADTALVFWIDVRSLGQSGGAGLDHWACVVRSSGPPAWIPMAGTGSDRTWSKADDSLPGRLRNGLAERGQKRDLPLEEMARQRFEPLAPHLAARGSLPAVQRLLVIPVCAMAGIPLEALTDRYTISYIPSATIHARLAEKHRPIEEPSLLALGDPAFKEPDAPALAQLPEHGLLVVQVIPGGPAAQAGIRAGDVLLDYDGTTLQTTADFKPRPQGEPVALHIWRRGKVLAREVPAGKLGLVVHRQPAPVALKEQREMQTLLASSRGSAPRPLPGTRQEVEALARLLPSEHVRLLLGSKASEQELTELAASGKIRDYRLLHFATHGVMSSTSPTRSALLLANDRLPDGATQARRGEKVYTGRLTVSTLLDWQLDADLVTLSACETGLGRQGGGEGYLGFVQALLQAGAHSMVVSLWPVDDAATALLMMRFYENLLGKRPELKAPLGRAQALQEARQWLRRLTRSEAETLTAQLSQGQLRVTIRPLRPPTAPAPADREEHPYAHPYYWSAFVLLGDPD